MKKILVLITMLSISGLTEMQAMKGTFGKKPGGASVSIGQGKGKQAAPKELTTAEKNKLKVEIAKVHKNIVDMAMRRANQADALYFIHQVDEFTEEYLEELEEKAVETRINKLPKMEFKEHE